MQSTALRTTLTKSSRKSATQRTHIRQKSTSAVQHQSRDAEAEITDPKMRFPGTYREQVGALCFVGSIAGSNKLLVQHCAV
jgi:hypothetical protein